MLGMTGRLGLLFTCICLVGVLLRCTLVNHHSLNHVLGKDMKNIWDSLRPWSLESP